MEKMHLLRGFINDRLIAAAEEIFGVVEKTIIEDHAEVVRLQKLLDVFLQPVIKLQRTDPQQLSLSGDEFPPDQQQCEEDWSPGLGHEDPESTQMKEEEQQTSQEEDQLQGPESYTESSIFTPAFEEDPTQPSNLYEALMDRSREADFLLISTAEQIKTEPDGEDYRQSELTSVSPQLSAVLPHCSAAHSEDSERVCGMEVGEPPSVNHLVRLKPSRRVKKRISYVDTNARTSSGIPPEQSPSQSHATPSCCKVCGMAFYSMSSLIKHVKTHAKENNMLCGVCGIRLQSTENMKYHLQTHVAARFTCRICSKMFPFNSRLMEHMRSHTKEKQYQCPDCDKGFNNSGYLKKHNRIHTGEKPYCCNDCGKTFSRTESLKVHMRTHTGEKPYQCGDCDKGFCSSGGLRKHIRSHTGEKPYQCGDCGKAFSLKENLIIHQRTHTGERPYCCDNCGKQYITRRQLKAHMLTHRRETSY